MSEKSKPSSVYHFENNVLIKKSFLVPLLLHVIYKSPIYIQTHLDIMHATSEARYDTALDTLQS